MWNLGFGFGDGVPGKGAVPLHRPSAIEALLAASAPFPLSSSGSPQEVQLTSIFAVQPVRWERCPVAAAHPLCRAWLTFQSHRGLAKNTLDAYSQGLEVFLRFLSHQQLSVPAVTRVHIGAYLASLQSHNGLSVERYCSAAAHRTQVVLHLLGRRRSLPEESHSVQRRTRACPSTPEATVGAE